MTGFYACFLAAALWALSFAAISAHPWESFFNLSGCHHGESRPEIATLKSYLRKFGYLPALPSNLTDSISFDESLQKAILSYQTQFHLNATGELDPSTLELMTQPRCGVADISSTHKLHGRGLYSFFPGRPTWPRRKTRLTYSISIPSDLPSNAVKEIFSRAFGRWAAVIPLTFSEVDDGAASADIKIGFYSGEHGDGEGFDGFLGTLAHAFSPPDGRLHLDADENWAVVSGGGGTAISVDMESVAVHEIGHLLGLGHSSVQEAIMYPTIRVGSRRLALASDDVEGVQSLYGINPTFNGGTSPPSATTSTLPDTSAAAGVGSSLVGILVAATLLIL